MKNRSLALIVLFILPLMAFGQNEGYDVVNNQDKELAAAYGKKFPGYYITNDGSRTDCLILFEEGGALNFYETTLSTSLSYAGESENVRKHDLKAFFVNSRLYIPTTIEGKKQWVHVQYQGAIQRFGQAVYSSENTHKELNVTYDEEKQTNVASMDTSAVYAAYWTEVPGIQKLDQEPENPILINKAKVMEYVVDNDDLWTKIKNKEKGYKQSLAMVPGAESFPDKMFAIYNKWYDESNPGKITYYPQSATYISPDSPGSSGAVTASVVSEVASSDEPHFAPRIDAFKGRPTAAGAAVASVKPEVAVKKESFTARLNRITADGNKVGVLVTCKNLVVNPYDMAEGITKAPVRGSYGPLDGLSEVSEALTAELNKSFSTDVFEAVDYSKIPYKEMSYGKIDDWWSTKYKVLVLYDIEPFYNAFYKTNTSTGEREYNAYMRVKSEMIVMAAEDIKPDKLKYVIGSPISMGSYVSDDFIGPKETEFDIIQELKAAINPPSDEEVIKALMASQSDGMAKFIKKMSK